MGKLLYRVVEWFRGLLQRIFRHPKMPSLNERFIDFCRHYPGAEEIDSIPLTPEQETRRVAKNLRRADFFFQSRTIICEIKELEIDTSGKLADIMKQAGIGPDTLMKGRHIVEQLFQKLQKGSKLFGHALKLVMTPLSNHFTKAVTQIRDTKEVFDLPDADGLLIILNDSVDIGGPPLVYKRLKKRLLKKDGQGEPFHIHLRRVLYIGETHAIETPDGDQRVNVTLPNPHAAERHEVEAFVFKLNEAWAKHSGQTFAKAGPEVEALLEGSQIYIDVK